MESQRITLPFLQELIAQTEPNVTVLSFEVSHGAERGDNYTSILFRVKVTGTRLTGSAQEDWDRSLIIKLLPDSLAHRQLYRSDLLFRNEVAFYKEALASLLKFQSSTGVSDPFTAVPKCLMAEQDILVLEDLKVRGFVMVDRKAGLDFQHCVAVFREIARFHALSLAMKCQSPKMFQECVASKILESFFTAQSEAYYKDYYNNLRINALAMVGQGLQEHENSIYLKKFEEFLDENIFFKTMMRLARPSEPLAVLSHGDFWTNNIMFRYSSDGSIEEVCFVDFQCARYCSPALDLYNCLYACAARELRTVHLQTLLTEYCIAMGASLNAMGCAAGSQPYCETTCLPNMIQEEIKANSLFGLGLALDMIPICTCDSAVAPDLYHDTSGASGAAEPSAQPVTPFGTEYTPECQRRMTDLVRDLVDLGHL